MAIHAHSTPAPEDGAYLEHLSRQALEARIENAIALLDLIDDDPDLKADTDTIESDTLDEHGEDDKADFEPTLGWPNNAGRGPVPLSHAASIALVSDGELEDNHDRERDQEGDDRNWPEVEDQTSREFSR